VSCVKVADHVALTPRRSPFEGFHLGGSLAVQQPVFYLHGKKGPQSGAQRGLLMTRADKALVIVLRVLGVSTLFALVAVFIPLSWMAAVHSWLGLGDMPNAPVVEYLARSVSTFYALLGALCLVISYNLERYRPLAGFLGVAFILIGLVLLGVDLGGGMPWSWLAVEGPKEIGIGVLLYFLARSPEARGQNMNDQAREL
jgi:hypothetical protein